jgi:hypothetical protein
MNLDITEAPKAIATAAETLAARELDAAEALRGTLCSGRSRRTSTPGCGLPRSLGEARRAHDWCRSRADSWRAAFPRR